MSTILITGANRGIGLEMVKQYSQDGWRVLACCRSPSEADELTKLSHQKANIQVLKFDASDAASVNQLANQVRSEAIDILMNNAGVWGPQQQGFGATDIAAWLEAFKINTIAPQLLAEAFIDNIANSKLKIIANMSSTMGSIGFNNVGSYYIYRSTKAALNAITKSMAIDLKDREVKVVALHPGWVKTAMGGPNAQITPEESVKGIKHVLSKLSLKDSGSFLDYNRDKLEW